MPARKRTWTPDIVRKRIQTTMIVNRLTDHIHDKVEMSATQVTAALGLLRKVLPDLAVTDVNLDGEIRNRDISDKPFTAEEWAERYSTTDSVGSSTGTAESVN